MTAEGLIIILIVGAIAGWLAGTVVRGRGFGLIGDIIVGILGAFLASWLLPRLGVSGLGSLGGGDSDVELGDSGGVPEGAAAVPWAALASAFAARLACACSRMTRSSSEDRISTLRVAPVIRADNKIIVAATRNTSDKSRQSTPSANDLVTNGTSKQPTASSIRNQAMTFLTGSDATSLADPSRAESLPASEDR